MWWARKVGLGFRYKFMILSCPAVKPHATSSAGANTDLSGLTNTMENGLPENILGGIGSALARAGGNTFLAAPDRGPNATPYNTAVDDTASCIARFQTVTMTLTPSTGERRRSR